MSAAPPPSVQPGETVIDFSDEAMHAHLQPLLDREISHARDFFISQMCPIPPPPPPPALPLVNAEEL